MQTTLIYTRLNQRPNKLPTRHMLGTFKIPYSPVLDPDNLKDKQKRRNVRQLVSSLLNTNDKSPGTASSIINKVNWPNFQSKLASQIPVAAVGYLKYSKFSPGFVFFSRFSTFTADSPSNRFDQPSCSRAISHAELSFFAIYSACQWGSLRKRLVSRYSHFANRTSIRI